MYGKIGGREEINLSSESIPREMSGERGGGEKDRTRGREKLKEIQRSTGIVTKI